MDGVAMHGGMQRSGKRNWGTQQQAVMIDVVS